MKKMRTLVAMLAVAQLWACNGGGSQDKPKDDKKEVVAKKEEAPKVVIDEYATLRAQMMAGVEVANKGEYDSLFNLPATKQHYDEFNKSWAKLDETHLSKFRAWRDSKMTDITAQEGNTLFYPFSGPDFLNAYTFFPNCDTYLMFGLEEPGKLVDLKKMPVNYLASLRKALSVLFQRNYFITSQMGGDLWGKGVLPIVNVFMARTGNKIVKIERFYLDKEGKAIHFPLEDEKGEAAKGAPIVGITVEFMNEKRSKSQRIYYVGTDVADGKMKSKMELATFIKSFKNKVTFIKSASYILHNTDFEVMRRIVLDDTKAVLQDDTGVRYSEYIKSGWDVKLFGKYSRPIADFGLYAYQPDVAQIFQKDTTIEKIDFTFGYHYIGSKETEKGRDSNTSLFLCKKK
jgi:hypothetical protein